MLTPYELFVGLRYTRAKRRNHFISFISITSMLGVALGVAALIVVLSVMNGFQKELRTRILGVASHVQIMGLDGKLSDWREDRRASTKPSGSGRGGSVRHGAGTDFPPRNRAGHAGARRSCRPPKQRSPT